MERSTPPQLLATWNAATSAWERPEETLCGHSVVYSETWPSSGMTLAGRAYELPTSAPHTDGSAFSSSPGLQLLPTPEAKLGSSGPDYARMNRPGTGGDSLHEAVGRLAGRR